MRRLQAVLREPQVQVKFNGGLPKSDANPRAGAASVVNPTPGRLGLRRQRASCQKLRSLMLLRLSRISFWLAAAVAALTLIAPAGHETLLMAIVSAGSLLAFAFWRSGLRSHRHQTVARVLVPEASALDPRALHDIEQALRHDAGAAASFEAALHAVARHLRSELGALEATVHEIHRIDAGHVYLSDRVESQPGFRTVERRVRLNASPLGDAVRSLQVAVAASGAVAVPVVAQDRVVAAIELSGIEVRVEPGALAALLETARAALSARRALEPANPLPAAPQLAAPRDAAPSLVGAQVLVVQDNVVEPEAAARMLQHLGCHATVASGMLDGLQALCRRQFDLVLIDMQMSGMSGAEGLNWLRRNAGDAYEFASSRDTPVVALTLPGSPQDRERIRELGFDDQLCKPFRRAQLHAMLSKHLSPSAEAGSSDRGGRPGRGDAPGGAPADASQVLDPAALARLGELDPTGANHLIERVLQAFKTSVARLRPQFDAARPHGDRAAIRLVAHTLKSSSGSIGAVRLTQLCTQVESAIRLGAEGDLEPLLDAMSASLDTTLHAIDALLNKGAP
jgi:CheY-like chemotaxis protein